ncbi:MAG: sigma-70 family RNA polymerase sigma factor [Acidobacteriota bacterium]
MSSEREISDLDLVRGIKEGDDLAFERMVARYHARVYSLAYGVLRNSEDAEEATQDAFLTLYRKIGTFDESKKFFSWFYRVALNTAYSRARRRPALPTVAIDDYLPRFLSDGHLVAGDVPDGAIPVDDDAALRELAAKAEGFISELPEPYRDVIWMNDVEQMTANEIADILEISIPAFKSRLHRARLYVRQRLAEISRPPAQVAAAEAR